MKRTNTTGYRAASSVETVFTKGDHMLPTTSKLIAKSLLVFALMLGSLVLWPASDVYAVGEADTAFHVYLPPNANSARRVALVVTSLNPGVTTVNVIDEDWDDGDSDDTYEDQELKYGQSLIVFIYEGSVNDDRGGKGDGDFFTVTANRPVICLMITKSDWQHDWVPSDAAGGIGQSFIIWSPPVSSSPTDLNLYAYYDNTEVYVERISNSAKTTSGVTDVDVEFPELIIQNVLDAGEDLIFTKRQGLDSLASGHSYRIRASKPITMQYGALGSLNGKIQNTARDGGGFVTSNTGASTGSLYYFMVPHNEGNYHEKELRVISFEDGAECVLSGKKYATDDWNQLYSFSLDRWQTEDFVGKTDELFKTHHLYKFEVTNGANVALFEANWMETGSFGTSDYASWVSSSEGRGAGKEFMAYMGPPGTVSHFDFECSDCCSGQCTENDRAHLYVAADQWDTDVHVYYPFQNGLFDYTVSIPADHYHVFAIGKNKWNAMNDPSAGKRPYLRVESTYPVSVISANHNDNWLAFASGRGIPNLEVTLEGGGEMACEADGLPLQVTVRNPGLNNVTSTDFELALQPGLEYDSGSGDFGEPTDEGLDTELGVNFVKWFIGTIPPGGEVVHNVTLAPNCQDINVCFSGIARVPEARGKARGYYERSMGSSTVSLLISDETTVNYGLIAQFRPNITVVRAESTEVETQSVVLFGVSTDTDKLYKLDIYNAEHTAISSLSYADGTSGSPDIGGLAWSENGRLFGMDNAGRMTYLVEIEPITGDVSRVAQMPVTYPQQIEALSSHPDGFLYAGLDTTSDDTLPEVLKINPNTGVIEEEIYLDDNFNIDGLSFNSVEEEDSYYCVPPPEISFVGMFSFASDVKFRDDDSDGFSETMIFSSTEMKGVDVPVYDPLRDIMDELTIEISGLELKPSTQEGVQAFELTGTVIEDGLILKDSTGFELLKLDLAVEGGYIEFNGEYGTLVAHVKNPTVNNTNFSVLLDYFFRQPRGWPTPMVFTLQAATPILPRVSNGDTINTTVSGTVKTEGGSFAPEPVCGVD